jgi:hypothetical protein
MESFVVASVCHEIAVLASFKSEDGCKEKPWKRAPSIIAFSVMDDAHEEKVSELFATIRRTIRVK